MRKVRGGEGERREGEGNVFAWSLVAQQAG